MPGILDEIRKLLGQYTVDDINALGTSTAVPEELGQLQGFVQGLSPENLESFRVRAQDPAEALSPWQKYIAAKTGEDANPLDPSNLKAIGQGALDLARGLAVLVPQTAQILSPSVADLKQIPGIDTIIPELVDKPESYLGIIPKPTSVLMRGAEVLGLPQQWERTGKLTNADPFEPGSSAEHIARFIGEISGVSPVLDVAFGLGIDPDRTTMEQRYRAFPTAALQLLTFGSGGFGAARKLVDGKPLVALADVAKANDTRLMSAFDLGKTLEAKPWDIGDSILTKNGLAEIVEERARSYRVRDGNGAEFSIPKNEARRMSSSVDSLSFNLEKATEIMDTAEAMQGVLPSSAMKAFFTGPDAPLSPARAGELASELLSDTELKQLPVAEAYIETLRRSLRPEEFALSIKQKTPGISDAAAISQAQFTITNILDSIRATATEAGLNLNQFSQMAEFFEAQRRLSPDAAVRLQQLNKEAAIGGIWDYYRAYIDKPQRSSMISQPVTFTRNTLTQGARGLIQGIEQALGDTTVATLEYLKSKEILEGTVNPKFLDRHGRLDYSRVFADTLGNLFTIGKELSDTWDLTKTLARDQSTGGQLARYSNDTFKALLKGEDPPVAPEFFTGRFDFWNTIKKYYPKEMDKILNSPTGETPVAIFNPIVTARFANNFKKLFEANPELPPNTTRLGSVFKETIPSFIDVAASAMSTLNSMGEIWQRRLFATARLNAHALREGMSLEDFVQSGMRDAEGIKSTPPKTRIISKGKINPEVWGEHDPYDFIDMYPELRDEYMIRPRQGEFEPRFRQGFLQVLTKAHGEAIGIKPFLEDPILEFAPELPGVSPRPQAFDKALADSVAYSLDSTFANRTHGKFGTKLMDLWSSFPALHQVLTPFPNYLLNRFAFISERTPATFLRMLNKDFLKTITGEITEADVVADMRRDFYSNPKNKNKEFFPPEPEDLAPKMDIIRRDAQRLAAENLGKATVGTTALALGSFIRNSAIAGTRWNEIRDIVQTNENGRHPSFDARSFDVLALPLAFAEMEKALVSGRDMGDVFTPQDMSEILAGIRRVDDTGMAIFDIPQSLERGSTSEAFLDFAGRFLGSNIGKFFTFMRTSKDLAGLADLRAYPFEGLDELNVPNQQVDPFLGPALNNLPRGFQRSILGEPLPDLNSPFKSEHLHNEYPLYRWMTGANLRSKTQFEDLIDTTDITISDAIGRQPSQEMKQLMAYSLGKLFDSPDPSGKSKQTLGDIYTENILNEEAYMRKAGIKVTAEWRKQRLREIFSQGREASEPLIRAQILQSKDLGLILRTLGKDAIDSLTPFERSLLKGAN